MATTATEPTYVQFSIRVTPDVFERLKAIADAAGRSMASEIRLLVNDHIETQRNRT
jgi:predicted DNA-binding protein